MNCEVLDLVIKKRYAHTQLNVILLLFLKQHAFKNTYKNAFIMYHPTILVSIYAFAISYAIFMHLGSTEEITFLEIGRAHV